jgi:hypothetical protein
VENIPSHFRRRNPSRGGEWKSANSGLALGSASRG